VPRKTIRDLKLDRQRTLIGVDRVERQLADLSSTVLKLLDIVSRETKSSVLVDAHTTRIKQWYLQYGDDQDSSLELGDNPDGK